MTHGIAPERYPFISGKGKVTEMFNYGMGGNQFMYGQPSPPQPQQPQGTGNNMIWVQGITGVKAYPVAPGAAVWMMDSEDKKFYIKSVDGSGIPNPIRVFQYEEIRETPQLPVQSGDFVTREELEKRLAELRGGNANE